MLLHLCVLNRVYVVAINPIFLGLRSCKELVCRDTPASDGDLLRTSDAQALALFDDLHIRHRFDASIDQVIWRDSGSGAKITILMPADDSRAIEHLPPRVAQRRPLPTTLLRRHYDEFLGDVHGTMGP
jgi:hypothetical protein